MLIRSLAFIFFLSGFASLIYQVAWQRLLTLHYGVGPLSVTLIVSIYMAGLGVGGLLGGFLAERIKQRLALYCIVELLIGVFGLVSLPFLDLLGRYTAGSNYLVSSFYILLFFFIPTSLMGITLPLITKIFNHLIQNFLHTVSFLYFINTIGAAVGALFASYILISFFGMDTAIYLAAIINFVLAGLIFLSRTQKEQPYPAAIRKDTEPILGSGAYIFVFVTGFLAIGYEIVWFRIVGVLVKSSPYAFSTVLSIVLFGIGFGSYRMSKYLREHQTTNKKSLLFLLQFLIGSYVMVVTAAYYYLTKYTAFEILTRASFGIDVHPSLPRIFPSNATDFVFAAYRVLDVFMWPMIFVFLPALFMGASFPLIAWLALSEHDKEGKTVGRVYFFNTIGNVAGGVVTGFLLLALLGTEITLLVFSLVGIVLGIFVSSFRNRPVSVFTRVAVVMLLVLAGLVFFPKKGELYETMHQSPGEGFQFYSEEGIDTIVVTYERQQTVVNYIGGLGHGARPGYGFYYEAIEAASFAPKVENVLIIGYGTGSITEVILKSPGIKKITIVELSDTLINNLRKMSVFRDMLADERINLIIDDGRRFLLRTEEKFDLILIDALKTTTSYSNNVYSRQFFEMISQHLNDGGIFLIWMDEYKVIPKTVSSVFDHVRLYKFFCLASNRPFERNGEREQKLIMSFSPKDREGIRRHADAYVGDQRDILKMVDGYPINQDWKPATEYFLGLKAREALLFYNQR